MHQRNAQRHPGVRQRVVITGSLGNPEGILDFAHRGIVGSQHTIRYSREVNPADDHGVGHGVGVAGHGQPVLQVVSPSGTTQLKTGTAPRSEGDR